MLMRRQKFLLFRIYKFQDSQAYGKLYDLYFERIRRFILFKLPSREDAQEMTSEVFLRGWEYATSSRIENANAFFYRIARNLIADFYRARKIETSIENAGYLKSDDDIEKKIGVKEETRQLLKVLKTLKVEYQEVLIMKYLDEMSTAEIADALEKSSNNIRVTLHRAKKALQEKSK